MAEFEHPLDNPAAELVQTIADNIRFNFLHQLLDLGGTLLRFDFLQHAWHAAAGLRLLHDLPELNYTFLYHMVSMVIKRALSDFVLFQDLRQHSNLLGHREHLQPCLNGATSVLVD